MIDIDRCSPPDKGGNCHAIERLTVTWSCKLSVSGMLDVSMLDRGYVWRLLSGTTSMAQFIQVTLYGNNNEWQIYLYCCKIQVKLKEI